MWEISKLVVKSPISSIGKLSTEFGRVILPFKFFPAFAEIVLPTIIPFSVIFSKLK
jgi:hypothetical protein